MTYTVKQLSEQILEGADNTWTTESWYDWDAFYAQDDWENKRIERLEAPKLEQNASTEPFSWNEFKDALDDAKSGLKLGDIGTAVSVESYGGEGQGDQYWFVFTVVDAEEYPRFFKVDGYYASYDGGYYDDIYEVFPKRVEVTQWSNAE